MKSQFSGASRHSRLETEPKEYIAFQKKYLKDGRCNVGYCNYKNLHTAGDYTEPYCRKCNRKNLIDLKMCKPSPSLPASMKLRSNKALLLNKLSLCPYNSRKPSISVILHDRYPAIYVNDHIWKCTADFLSLLVWRPF